MMTSKQFVTSNELHFDNNKKIKLLMIFFKKKAKKEWVISICHST
jgi:hypothetical protein